MPGLSRAPHMVRRTKCRAAGNASPLRAAHEVAPLAKRFSLLRMQGWDLTLPFCEALPLSAAHFKCHGPPGRRRGAEMDGF